MAEPAIQDSSGLAATIALLSRGNARLTTVSYIPGVGEEASVAKMSVNMEMKMGSDTAFILGKTLSN